MKKVNLDYNTYELKFKTPFATSKGIFDYRKGFIIELKDEKGISSVGDAAPFPEFGSESFEEAEDLLNRIEIILPAEPPYNFLKIIEEILMPLEKFPSIKCGLEQALISYISKTNKTNFNDIIGINSNREILVNALVNIFPEKHTLRKISQYVKDGFETIKLKIGRDDFEEELRIITGIFSKYPKLNVRLDVNGQWNYEAAVERLNKLKKFNIEYVEQPVSSSEELIRLINEVDVPIAADESLRKIFDVENFINNSKISALILKPMMLGGIIPVKKILEMVKGKNIKTIVTSSFESYIGRSYAVFAASLIKNKYAHGVNTENVFVEDLGENIFKVNRGKIIIG